LIDYYRKQGVVIDIDGSRNPEQVFDEIKQALDSANK